MSAIKIYRGTNQIGGIVTEVSCGDHRILIDFGANLPGTKNSSIEDDELVKKVWSDDTFTGETDAVLFTHYHGDHVGLKNCIPDNVPMYVGGTAKEIMKIIATGVDYVKEQTGHADEIEFPTIEKMIPYKIGTPLNFNNIIVTPLVCDHSALDSYMFVIEVDGKRILYTGDFRDHGIPGEETFEKMIKEHVGKIDILVTEGTMVSRIEEEKNNHVRTEEELGEEAKKIFNEHKENVVLVSSTNLDSVMEFYHATPDDKAFLCDPYQARVMNVAIEARWKFFKKYRYKKQIYVLCPNEYKGYMTDLLKVKDPLIDRCPFSMADPKIYSEKGFVMLARPNRNPNFVVGRFEERMNQMNDPFITYSMWGGYLKGGKAEDPAIVEFMDGYMDKEHMKPLHTSGHAYVETLKKLMDMTNPDVIIPMHTEDAKAFTEVELFKEYKDRLHTLNDGEMYLI